MSENSSSIMDELQPGQQLVDENTYETGKAASLQAADLEVGYWYVVRTTTGGVDEEYAVDTPARLIGKAKEGADDYEVAFEPITSEAGTKYGPLACTARGGLLLALLPDPDTNDRSSWPAEEMGYVVGRYLDEAFGDRRAGAARALPRQVLRAS
ncbi:MAG TPA: hypothetical protein VLE99_05495 [Candidatus Saccharimonadales bacterium]|nr:hypothetical protein [Candidatus Saccharimonadales bacterium]